MADHLLELQQATRRAVVDGGGNVDPSIRRQIAAGQPPPELASLVGKIRDRAYTVTDQDLDVLRSRYSEDQLFEVIVAAAIGAAEHRLTSALAVLEGEA
jgi:hypothetical protein